MKQIKGTAEKITYMSPTKQKFKWKCNCQSNHISRAHGENIRQLYCHHRFKDLFEVYCMLSCS